MTDDERYEACESPTFESFYDPNKERWTLRPIPAALPVEEVPSD